MNTQTLNTYRPGSPNHSRALVDALQHRRKDAGNLRLAIIACKRGGDRRAAIVFALALGMKAEQAALARQHGEG